MSDQERRLRNALVEAEAALSYVQPFVGLLTEYLDRANYMIAYARSRANSALGVEPFVPLSIRESSDLVQRMWRIGATWDECERIRSLERADEALRKVQVRRR